MALGSVKNSPLCRLASDAALFSSTLIENLFVQEFMLDAPGDFVKVYLFGLMHSQYPGTAEPSLEKFAAALSLDVDRVKKAFSYWRNKGLLRESKHGYEYLNVRSAMFDSKVASQDDRIYEHAELSNRLEAVAAGRSLTSAEYTLLFDLVDVDGFEDEAVLLLLQFCMTTFGKKLNKTRLESIAREWKQAGRSTEAEARAFVLAREQKDSPANKILAKLGILRIATEAEHKLYRKWTEEWMFSHDAIAAALEAMTGVQKPNFNYLDKRLSTLRDKGRMSARQILEGEQSKIELNEKVQECMFRLGLPGMVSDSHRQYYLTWTKSYGLKQDAILLICDEVCSQGNPSFKTAESLASSYARRGFCTAEDIRKDRAVSTQTAKLLRTLGLSRMPTESDKARMNSWINDFPMELIQLAASYASDSGKPMPYLARILDNWREKGIRSVEAAREEHKDGKKRSSGATNTLHYDNERQYEKDTLDDLIEDLRE